MLYENDDDDDFYTRNGEYRLDPKFHVQRGNPHQPFFVSENYMHRSFIRSKNVGIGFVSFVTIHAFDRRTDRQTDAHRNNADT